MKKFIVIAVAGLLSIMPIIVRAADSEPDVQKLLVNSDRARGGGNDGLIWEIAVRNSAELSSEPDMRMRLKATDSASLAETLEPLKSKGAKMLQVDRNMWLSKPGLKKPIPISARQRLTGLASIGDVAATNYVKDYSPKYLRMETIEGEPCHVLELTARERQTTYDRIVYWISISRGIGVQAEFLSLAGKKLKTATFKYGNTVQVDGKPLPFISQMIIKDSLSSATTTLDYSQVRLQAIRRSEFDVSHLE